MLRTGRKWLAASMLAALLALPGVTWGAGFDYGSFQGELGLRFGYGKSTRKASVHLYSLLPRWGIFLLKPGQRYGVGLSFVVEGIVSVAEAEGDGFELGFTPMLKLSLPLGRTAMFFIEGGEGLITESFDSPAVAHAFNFTPQVGAGFDIALMPRLGLTLAYRFRHSSNAGLYDENPAFNCNFFHGGLTYFY
ncbi:MAG: acyloxyacyl hydrolase [Deltaproteobacteria bacterium]|nr:acyloxyacyl hydrolase [Deltaproteobacteria bacterium]